MERILATCKEENPLDIKTMEEREWILLCRCEARGSEASELQPHDWVNIGDNIDPPLSKYVEIISDCQEKITKTIPNTECTFGIEGHGLLIYWIKVLIPRPVWDDLNPAVKAELQTKRIWNEYWTAYSKGSVGFFPGYAESWKAHYGPVSYQLLKGLKKLFDPKNILNPQKIPEEG